MHHGRTLAVVTGARERVVAELDELDSFAWSPAGDLLVYSSCVDYPNGLIQVVRPDGTGRRTLARTSSCWPNVAWSSARRWIAFTDRESVNVLDLTTRTMRRLDATTRNRESAPPAWSSDGRLLALDDAVRGVTIGDAATGATRALTPDHASELSWSPVGRVLAYKSAGGLRTATPGGRVRTVIAAAGEYGGIIRGISWARPSTGTRYRRPARRSPAVVTSDGLTARSPIDRLTADGSRVAFVSCGHVFTWTPATGVVEQAETVASLSPACSSPTNPGRGISSAALSGDRVAFGSVGGGNITFWSLESVTLTPRRPGHLLGEGRATTGTPKTNFVGNPVGAGGLLVFAARDEAFANGRVATTRQRIVRAEPRGCPCPTLASEPGPFVPNDVESGRIAAVGDNAVVLLDGRGDRSLTVLVRARSAQLAGSDSSSPPRAGSVTTTSLPARSSTSGRCSHGPAWRTRRVGWLRTCSTDRFVSSASPTVRTRSSRPAPPLASSTPVSSTRTDRA